MALLFTRMAACLLCFTASLLTYFSNILTLPRSMALLATKVGTTFQFSSADLSTADLRKPARLVFQRLLSTQARFLCEERTFRAGFIVAMTAVWYSWMATLSWTFTVKPTGRRGCSTRQRRLKYSLTTMTANFIEDSFSTTSTWPFVTKLWTSVIPTLQHPPTRASADMLGFISLINNARSSQRSKFAFGSLAFCCLLFARTAPLTTLMTTTIQGSSASSHALRLLFVSLMAHSGRMGAPAAT